MARSKKRSKQRRRKPPLGSGKRFRSLSRKLARRGARNPNALAAHIGRKKYGKKKMAKMAARDRRRRKRR